MSVTRRELQSYLATLLSIDTFADYAPNGLQIEGRETIERVITGVSANQALIDEAVRRSADALLVHHGFFWKNEPRVLTGIRAKRVRALFEAGISLFGYHLPLDAHADYGNNVGLIRALGGTPAGTFSAGHSIDGWIGRFDSPQTLGSVVEKIHEFSVAPPVVFGPRSQEITQIGTCTGGGASFFEAAVEAGCQLFVSGEASEMAQGLANELEVPFIAAGHHATERFGPQMLGAHLADKFDLNVEFVDIPNPI